MSTTPLLPERGFHATAPARTITDAMLTGNGTLGAMVLGEPLDETVALTRAGLFMPLHEPLPPVNQGEILPELRTLLRAKAYHQAAERVVQKSHEEGWDDKRWTDPFVPAFDLRIQMNGTTGPVERYTRSVDFMTACTHVRWSNAGDDYARDCFASRADEVIVVRLSTTARQGLDVSLQFEHRSGDSKADAVRQAGVKQSTFHSTSRALSAEMEFARQWKGSLAGCVAFARVVTDGGAARADGTTLRVVGATSITVLIGIDLWHREAGTSQDAMKRLAVRLSQVDADPERLLQRSSSIHGEIFGRSRLTLNTSDGLSRDAAVETLLQDADGRGTASTALIEKQFDAGRYAILCSSGELPPNLQGVWAPTWVPPWSGDYTQNGNLQTAIASNLSTGMAECMESYFRYLESQLPHYRENARRMFDCRGIHVPSRTSSHGLNNHFDATWPMTFWTAGAGWASHFFWDYFQVTGDLKFLRERAFPFMCDSALFYEDFLIESADGRLHFSPSYSPENHVGSITGSQSCVDATMDLAVVKELLATCVRAANILGSDSGDVDRWQAILAKLPEYQINEDGALKEWLPAHLADNHRHRHASHLYALYYGLPDDVADDPKLKAAFAKALQRRIEFRRQEPTGEMAFGLVQMAQAAISLGLKDVCTEILGWLSTWYWTPSLGTTHNRHQIFNVDLCGGFPEVVRRMIVDARPGRLVIHPALPDAWDQGQIEGISCARQIKIHRLAWRPGTIELDLESGVVQTVVIELPPSSRPGDLITMRADARQQVVELAARERKQIFIGVQE